MNHENSRNRRARYDEHGNIILPAIESKKPEHKADFEAIVNATEHAQPVDAIQWGLPEEPAEDISQLPSVQREQAAQRVSENLYVIRTLCAETLGEAQHETIVVAKQALAEGERQLRTSLDDGLAASSTILGDLSTAIRSVGRFLTQPVLVPSRRKHVKQYSRGTLFALDIVRFGGTFAMIFAVLFSAMNYESFAAIASARIEPILEFTRLDNSAAVQKSLAEKLRQVPTLPTAGDGDEGLNTHLPVVGPPNDILIIPKLNLRAPIVSIPTDSLVQEDWKQLESDIQSGLESGVAHYPGTAEPGQAGNFFVTGHSSYFPWASGGYKSVFARLSELDVGDEYWVYHGGDKYRYVIETKKEILPSDVTVLDQPVGKRIGTLMTCTPVGTTLRRLILTSQEVDPVTGDPMHVGEHQRDEERPDIRIEALPI